MIAYLSIGSNIDPDKHIQACKDELRSLFSKVRFSSTYETEAVGFEGDNFHNLVAEIDCEHSLPELIDVLKATEDKLGRVRTSEKFCSRSMDIDVILYGDKVCNEPIELPRAEILDNAYVLYPLVELAPELIAPDIGQTYQSIWDDFDKTKQPLRLI